jgi:hypothetical protein
LQPKAFFGCSERLAGVQIVSQHPNVAGRKLAKISAATLALLCGAVGATGACDSTVTSVGAWEPRLTQAAGGVAGGVAGGSTGGSGAVSGTASGSETGGSGGGGGGVGGAVGVEPVTDGGGPPDVDGPGLYLEAESGELTSDPNVPDSSYAIIDDRSASGGKYILPPAGLVSGDTEPGTALAHYTFTLDQAGDYLIWGRINTPDISSDRLWFQVDGGGWTLWRLTVGKIWYWHRFHDNRLYDNPMHFMLGAGQHELLIANNVPNARLDKLYITSIPNDVPPGNTTPCHPPHTVDFGGGDCHPSCGLQAKPNMPTTCDCANATTKFPAYDCTAGQCCFLMP